MPEQPECIGKRMRELLEGAAIGIIPFAPADDYFGTLDERHGSLRRYLFLGYNNKVEPNLEWSLFAFSPSWSLFDYGFNSAWVMQYKGLFVDGEIPTEVFDKNQVVMEEAGRIATRENVLSRFFHFGGDSDIDQEDDIKKQEAMIAKVMKTDDAIASRPDVKELLEAILEKPMTELRSNPLNIWGDYDFLWHDFGYFAKYKYTCIDSIERAKSYTVHWAYKRAISHKHAETK